MARKLRNVKLYLQDIIKSIDKINQYIAGHDFESFSSDGKTIDAVIRNLEILGEASNHLPKKFKESNNDVDWRELTDFRNVIVHEYFGINIEIIWDIITVELNDLYEKIILLNNSISNELIDWDE